MNSFSLDDIRAAAETKYAATEIDLGDDGKVVLNNVMQLSKEKRDQLKALQAREDADEAGELDQAEMLRASLRIAYRAGDLERLFELIGDNLAQLAELFNMYSKGTQAGEASASAS